MPMFLMPWFGSRPRCSFLSGGGFSVGGWLRIRSHLGCDRVAPNLDAKSATLFHIRERLFTFRNRSRDYPVRPQFEGVRRKFSVPPSAVGFPLNWRKIEARPRSP
jgi:hypothetical protein